MSTPVMRKGTCFNAQDLTHGITIAKNLPGDGLADDTDLVGTAHVLVVRKPPRPRAPTGRISKYSAEFPSQRGVPVLIARRDLGVVDALQG